MAAPQVRSISLALAAEPVNVPGAEGGVVSEQVRSAGSSLVSGEVVGGVDGGDAEGVAGAAAEAVKR